MVPNLLKHKTKLGRARKKFDTNSKYIDTSNLTPDVTVSRLCDILKHDFSSDIETEPCSLWYMFKSISFIHDALKTSLQCHFKWHPHAVKTNQGMRPDTHTGSGSSVYVH